MINISIAAARLDINSVYGSLLLDLVDVRIAYLNFIRLGDYVRKTHSAVVERPAPSFPRNFGSNPHFSGILL